MTEISPHISHKPKRFTKSNNIVQKRNQTPIKEVKFKKKRKGVYTLKITDNSCTRDLTEHCTQRRDRLHSN